MKVREILLRKRCHILFLSRWTEEGVIEQLILSEKYVSWTLHEKSCSLWKKNVCLWGGECVDFSFSPNVTLNYCYTSISSIWTSWVVRVWRGAWNPCQAIFVQFFTSWWSWYIIHLLASMVPRWHEISFSAMNERGKKISIWPVQQIKESSLF